MPDYDKKTDPYRVSERLVRAEIQSLNEAGKFPEGFHLVKQGKFTPGDETSYASVRVVTLMDELPEDNRPFCTHTAVLYSDGENRHVYLIAGTYDLTVEEAAEALA